MFRTLLGLVAVSGFVVFTPAADAQKGGGGGRGGGGAGGRGGSSGHSSPSHSSAGHSSPAHGSGGHSSPGHFSGHPSTFHGGSVQHHSANFGHNRFYGYGYGYGYGLGFGLGYPYGGYYSYPGYYGSPGYDSFDDPYDYPVYRVPAYNAAPAVVPEMPPVEDNSAQVQVIVPEPNASVWFDGAATTSRGKTRYFDTPPLAHNGKFNYTVKASWNQDGETMNAERVVRVRAGSRVVVDFTQPAPGQ